MSFANVTPYKQNIRPGFIGDYLSREHVLAGGAKINKASVIGVDAIKVQTTAIVAADATTMPVVALDGPIPDNEVLDFGGKKLARVNDAAVIAADTSITIDALGVALASGDVAYYQPRGTAKRLYAGSVIKIDQATYEAAGATGAEWSYVVPGATVANSDYVRVVAYDNADVDENNDVDILRIGTLLKVNFMYWSTLSTSVKAALRAAYEVTVGAPGQEVPAS